MAICNICPRNCSVDRADKTGACHVTDTVRAALATLHMWEEPCISGAEGSGAVFFSGCNLGCVFCQNKDIAAGVSGKDISVERLAQIFLEQQDAGANNINLVTPSHYVFQIKEALLCAKKKGLKIPVVYNSSAYEKVETLRELEGLVDIYLPDFKYMDSQAALKYSKAKDYPETAKEAIKEMYRQVGDPCFDDREMMTAGVIVRHLLLPGLLYDTKAVLKYLYETYRDHIYISIMNQYTPMDGISQQFPELGRRITEEEYDEAVDYAIDLGVENGFVQEGETAKDSFIPAFDYRGI